LPRQKSHGGVFFHGGRTYGTPLLAATAANISRGNAICQVVFYGVGGHIVSWFDLETCSKVIEDDAIGQKTYDFLLVFYINFGRVSHRFRYSRFYVEVTLLGDCDL